MLQQVMTTPEVIEFWEVPIPEPKADRALVRIMRIGMYGSDIHIYHGEHPFMKYLVTQGHEASGEIVAPEKGVISLRVEQRTTIEPQVVCDRCHPCHHGKYNLREKLKAMGSQTTDTASEFFVVDAAKVTPLPGTMSLNEGAMIEPLAMTVHVAEHLPELADAKVAILGSSPIGILLVQSYKALGAAQVLITDISDARLELARSCEVDLAVNTRTRNFGKVMVECLGPGKADAVYDCVGNDTTVGRAIQYIRKGSKLVLVAVYAGMTHVDLTLLSDHELDLGSTMMYRHEDYTDTIRLASGEKIQLKPLVNRHFAFGDYQKTCQYTDANRETTMKVLIDITPCEE